MKPSDTQTDAWLEFVKREVRTTPAPSFDEQWRRFNTIFENRPEDLGPPPAWVPTQKVSAASNLAAFMAAVSAPDLEALRCRSVDDRAGFWSSVIDHLGIPFESNPAPAVGNPMDPRHPNWLAGARLDITRACFTTSATAPAVISGDEEHDEIQTTSFEELERLVNRVANGIAGLGLNSDEGVALYMPMTLECVAAYLGVIRAGHHVVSIADSFAAKEVVKRLRLGSAGAVITVERFARGGREIDLYCKIRDAEAPKAIIITQGDCEVPGLRDGDLLWEDFLGDSDLFTGVAGTPDRVVNVLFSSGTTGDPKAIPWTQTTPIKCASDGFFHQDIRSGDVVAWPTNIGWMMGPWLIYAALVNGATIALFEGLPTGGAFARFVERAGVTMLGVVPSLVRAWRDNNATQGTNWTGIRVFSSTGEPSNREDYLWLMSQNGYRAPVIEYCGGTEIGGGYITGSVLQPASPATFTIPALGLDLVLIDDAGKQVDAVGEGEVFLVPPSIGLSERLLNRDHDTIYYEGCPADPNGRTLRRHGDQLQKLPGGFWRAQGRADDTMNLGGIKVSSKELERVLDAHPAVYEAAAVAVQIGGEGAEKLVVFAHLTETSPPEELKTQLQRQITTRLNPLFKIHDLVVTDDLPRTTSGKLMRRVLRSRYAGRPNPA